MGASHKSELPITAEEWYARGIALRQQGDTSGAIAALNKALQCQPDFAQACFDLACLIEASGPPDLANKTYQYLLTIAPNHVQGQARFIALQALLQQVSVPFHEGFAHFGRGDMENAALSFRQALALHPRVPDTLSNLALSLYHLRRFDEAQVELVEALRLQPNHLGALGTLGNMYQSTGQDDKAVAIYRQIIALKPNDIKAWANIGKVLQSQGDDAGAVAAYEGALKIDPRHLETLAEMTYRLHRLCRWDKMQNIQATFADVLTTTKQSASPFIVTLYTPAKLQHDNAKRYSASHHANGKNYDSKCAFPADARGDGKLRIGYLSADFYTHATAFLISELFEHHDKNRFEIIAYSCGKSDDGPEYQRIRSSVHTFRDVRTLDSHNAAELIMRDGIDIMVDLKGYTRGARMDILAQRPAPIQMHYLGFPGTTGAPFIDYFIADTITAPENSDALFSEKLIRLPHCYQINDRKRPLPAGALPREAYGLPAQGFVFCDFNNAYKITPEIFAIWMRLLAAVPGSVLWLYETHTEATANMQNVAKQQGIDPARLIAAPLVPIAQHLARYKHVDLFVDTFPVCGHTTASDALWCGVPVVTMMGQSFVSRVAASLLDAVELPQLVTADIKAYEALALELAQNPEKIAALKQHLENGRMRFPLFDSIATTKVLESAYEKAAERHRAQLAPEAFVIP